MRDHIDPLFALAASTLLWVTYIIAVLRARRMEGRRPVPTPLESRRRLMGAMLVNRAFGFASRTRLKQNEALLLIYMSLRARDADEPPRYFASKEESAVALGRSPERIAANPEAAYGVVKTALKGLVKAGAIELIRPGYRGHQSLYHLVYRDGIRPSSSVDSDPQSGWNPTPNRDGIRPPKENVGEVRNEEQEEGSPRRAPHLSPVDNFDAVRRAS